MQTGKIIKELHYWKWRYSIEVMQHAQTKLVNERLKLSLQEKDIELAKMRNAINQKKLEIAIDDIKQTEKEYGVIKKEIEDDIGMSLNNCAIDDVTLEVLDLSKAGGQKDVNNVTEIISKTRE